jgi:hypothetical protein
MGEIRVFIWRNFNERLESGGCTAVCFLGSLLIHLPVAFLLWMAFA